MLLRFLGLFFFLILFLSGCGWFRLPRAQNSLKIDTPEVWQAVDTKDQRRISQGWLNDFSHQDLSRLVKEAEQHNPNLQALASRLRVVKELSIQARAQRLPRFNLGGSAAWSENENTSTQQYGLTLGASWELDLWGKFRDLHRAAAADFESAVAEYRGAKLSLAAATAKSYCNLISAEQQWRLSVTTRDSFEKNLRIIERNYRSGVPNVRALDVQLGRSNVSQARRIEKARKLDRDNAIRSLEVLLGRYPAQAITPELELPQLSDRFFVGIPTSLIERRPDLQAARARIQASAYRASVARKNLRPNLSLLANGSMRDGQFGRLWNPSDLASTVLSNFTQALYAGGALEAEVRASVARNQADLQDYAQLALEALREVESSLAAEQSLREQEKDLRKEVEQAALAERQAERDYSEGIEGVDILSVLESQRRANNARSAFIRLQNERLQNRVDLYLALGGSA